MEYVFWYKISCLSVGLAIIFLGYLLFIKGIFNESGNVEGSFKDYRLIVKKAAPGTYFVLFGSLIIALTVFKGFNADEKLTHGSNKGLQGTDSTLIIKDSIKLK